MKDDNYSLPVDDTYEDAASAYREVAGRTSDPVSGGTPQTETLEPKTSAATTEPASKPANRGPDGKFAPKSKTEPTAKEVDNDDKPAAAAREQPGSGDPADKPVSDAPAAPVGGPPPSWSIKSKAAWDALPADVRTDILKRESEAKDGLAALADFKDLKPYADMAKQHGTTIGKALDRYVGFENMLKQNLGQGLATIAQNYGLDQEKAAVLFAKMAMHYSGGKIKMAGPGQQSGQQPADTQQAKDPLLEVLDPVLQPFRQQIDELKGQLTSREKASADAHAATLEKAILAFAEDPANSFFPELQETITFLLTSGKVPMTGDPNVALRQAYDLAARMHPEISEALIEQRLESERAEARKKEQEAADKAKAASRSITGSKVPGTVVQNGNDGPSDDDDLEAVVRAAYRLHSQA